MAEATIFVCPDCGNEEGYDEAYYAYEIDYVYDPCRDCNARYAQRKAEIDAELEAEATETEEAEAESGEGR